jgi:hypothetical protein
MSLGDARFVAKESGFVAVALVSALILSLSGRIADAKSTKCEGDLVGPSRDAAVPQNSIVPMVREGLDAYVIRWRAASSSGCAIRPRGTRLVLPAQSGEPPALRPLATMSWQRPNIGSRVNREVHARFWERLGVKLLRATRQLPTSRTLSRTSG